MYRITLSDGTVLKDLGVNTNNFISKERLSEGDFAGKLSGVKIEYTGGEDEPRGDVLCGEYGELKLSYLHDFADGTWFVLREYEHGELDALQSRGDIDYIAMMTGVTL